MKGDRVGSSESLVAVREAEPRDVPRILDLIRKKAAFDGVPDRVEATEDALHNHLFGDRPSAHVILGELGGRVVGFALFFLTFSSFLARPGIWLDDLYVDEDVRGNGVGAALLTHLARIAKSKGHGRIEWVTAADNSKGLNFYRRSGAEIQERVRVLRLGRAEFCRLAEQGTG